jgi:hypothetical protein
MSGIGARRGSRGPIPLRHGLAASSPPPPYPRPPGSLVWRNLELKRRRPSLGKDIAAELRDVAERTSILKTFDVKAAGHIRRERNVQLEPETSS